MSHGGGRENGREKEPVSGNGDDDYGRAIARIAVGQICETIGFQSLQESALDALSDIVIRYLRDLGKSGHFYANLAGRMECNIFDIIQGLEDLGSPMGVVSSGGALEDVNHCLCGSSTVREITHYVSVAEEVPFARSVPRFPITRGGRKLATPPSFLQIDEAPTGKHIPDWLPAFPDPHTYVHTPVWNERTTDPRTDKMEQARQRRKAERSLLNLHQRLACSVSEPPASSDAANVHSKANHVAESNNPFLAPPLQCNEKKVSNVVLPSRLLNEAAEKQISVLETFAPAIEAAKSGFCDSENGDKKKVLPNKRPVLHFKFGVGKKSLGMPVDLQLQNKGVGKTTHWFGRDDEKDDKKRRAEQILKESMENQQEVSQL